VAQLSIRLSVSLPWWWRIYMHAVIFYEYTIGGVNVDRASEFVARHARFYAIDKSGLRRRIPNKTVDAKTRRYFERAPLGHHVCPDDLDLDRG